MNYSVSGSSSLSRLLEIWRGEPTIRDNIVRWQTVPQATARTAAFPRDLHPDLAAELRQQGIQSLYVHQNQAWEAIQNRRNTVIVTETASGKTLCYNLPVVDAILRNPNTRALYLFPTKALTYDQQQVLDRLLKRASGNPALTADVYDGDTPAHRRSAIRNRSNVILTNPDMLHAGILPHHTIWADFLRSLQFIVIDEIHIYRGVFGSHVANLIRRLKRILNFYGANPLFILTSATIANPAEHAHRLIEAQVDVIDQDGSPHGARHFLLYNPPVVDPNMGLRRSASQESIRLAGDLLSYQVQTILFGRARRTVELLLKNLQHEHSDYSDSLHAYRSGYLPAERRSIEKGLRSGEVHAVVATSALELGIDIGSMDAVLLVGYPGTIAATRQQAGRAGRRQDDSLAVLVASSGPLDQFLMHHPEYLLSRSPERALINPDNMLIVLQHLRCAAFELTFREGDRFGALDVDLLKGLLELMAESGELHADGSRFFWMSDSYPASQISLRSTGASPVVLQSVVDDRFVTIGEVDQPSAAWMVHPGAIYLHEGQTFQVETLDFEKNSAVLTPANQDFYTEPLRSTTVEKISVTQNDLVIGGEKFYGELLVTTQVTGFRRIRWFTHETIGQEPLDLPPSQLRTTGFWLSISESTVEQLRSLNLWNSDPNDYGPNWQTQRNKARERDKYTCQVCGLVESGKAHHVHHIAPFRTFTSYLMANQLENLTTLCPTCHHRVEGVVRIRSGLSGLSYVLNNLAPLFLMCDASDLGDYADPECPITDGQPAVVIYDKVPAGIGLCESLYQSSSNLLAKALQLVQECGCKEGCPSCVGPGGENGIGGKQETLALLALLNGTMLQT